MSCLWFKYGPFLLPNSQLFSTILTFSFSGLGTLATSTAPSASLSLFLRFILSEKFHIWGFCCMERSNLSFRCRPLYFPYLPSHLTGWYSQIATRNCICISTCIYIGVSISVGCIYICIYVFLPVFVSSCSNAFFQAEGHHDPSSPANNQVWVWFQLMKPFFKNEKRQVLKLHTLAERHAESNHI